MEIKQRPEMLPCEFQQLCCSHVREGLMIRALGGSCANRAPPRLVEILAHVAWLCGELPAHMLALFLRQQVS